MNRFSLSLKELLFAVAIFFAVLGAFFALGRFAGWPNETSGWPVAVIAAAAMAAAAPILRVLGELQASNANVSLPGGINFDFSAAVAASREATVPPNIVTPGLMLQDTSQESLDRAAGALASEDYAVADLGAGREWYRSRLFALAGTATVLKRPNAIVLLGTLHGSPHRPGGWIRPRDLVEGMTRSDARYRDIWDLASGYLDHLRADEPTDPGGFPQYDTYRFYHDTIGDQVMMRILVNQMRQPDNGAAIERDDAPDWIDLQEAERLFATWLNKDQLDLDSPQDAQARALADTAKPYMLAVREGAYAGMVNVHPAQRRMLKKLLEP